MLDFKILKKSKKSRARLGILKTSNGLVETPAFVPVATQATIKTLDSSEVEKTGSQILIANTFHLHVRPGEKIIKKHGGLHDFMRWPKPLMTDSGGFQVFSLGFGRELGIGKMFKVNSDSPIQEGQQPKLLKISEKGVEFTSYVNGDRLFLGPKESIRIQEALGADIIFAFDECPPPSVEKSYMRNSMDRTHRWAKVCLEAKKTNQAIYGIVQGGRYHDLREESAKFISSLDFDGFGIGGEFGDNKKAMAKTLEVTTDVLPGDKPRHLLGVGHLEDMRYLIESGIDTFDCITPTHYGRRGVAFISKGRVELRKSIFLKDLNPLDKNCDCYICQKYTRSYLAHLIRADEITGLKLISFHNIYFFNTYVSSLREELRKGRI